MPSTTQIYTFCFLAITLTCLSPKILAEPCQPSKWGANDELGAANLITPSRTLAAAKLIKLGQSHPLGIVVDPNMPSYPPRSMNLQIVQPSQQAGKDLTDVIGWPGNYNDDMAQLWFGTGSQIDGLGHFGENDIYYNCNKQEDFAEFTGLSKLGAHNIPPLIGRGVLLNMASYFNVPFMQAGQSFGSADIKAAALAQGVDFREGDVIIFHTGWTTAKLNSEPDTWGSVEPGINNEGANYIASLNPLAVGADTWAVEAVPAAKGDKMFYGHRIFLKDHGIYILETMNTKRLAEEDVHEFMFVLGQARIKGTVQMIINPVAMW